ncbi:hypothetical protein ACFWDF_15265 [Streptomyces diastaticus]|uniref:hypothetical protein n=1 Tax=Streptomyces diastaticus TaxID=1956 RepID=UPI0036C48EAA
MAALDGALTAVPEDSATETAVLLLRPRAAPGAYGRAPSAVAPAGTTRPGRRTGLAALHDPPRPGHVYGVLDGFPHSTATPGSARGHAESRAPPASRLAEFVAGDDTATATGADADGRPRGGRRSPPPGRATAPGRGN